MAEFRATRLRCQYFGTPVGGNYETTIDNMKPRLATNGAGYNSLINPTIRYTSRAARGVSNHSIPNVWFGGVNIFSYRR